MNVLDTSQELIFQFLIGLYPEEVKRGGLIGPEGDIEFTDLARESVVLWRAPTAIGMSSPFATVVGSIDFISPHRALARELADRFLAVGYDQTDPKVPRPIRFRLLNLSSYEVREGHHFRISINYTMLFKEQVEEQA